MKDIHQTLDLIITHMPMGIVVTTMSDNVLCCSQYLLDSLHYEKSDLIGQNIDVIFC